jgi:predicted nucleotidyltransferase
MTPQQAETIKQIQLLAQSDQSIMGVILCGSLAKKTGNAKSDVDIIVVVTEKMYKQKKASKDYFWGTDFDNKNFSVEIDGKIVPKEFLDAVKSRGTENIKYTLYFSELIFSRDSEIERLFKEIKDSLNNEVLEKDIKIKKFYSMMKSSRFSFESESENTFLKHKLIHDTIYYAGRLILAINNRLFPCVKNMLNEIKTSENVPKNFFSMVEELLHSYAEEDLIKFYDIMENYSQNFHFDNCIRKGFVIENELFWFHKIVPFYDL